MLATHRNKVQNFRLTATAWATRWSDQVPDGALLSGIYIR